MDFWKRKQRFSIRKLTIGTVSVLLGTTLTMAIPQATVLANESGTSLTSENAEDEGPSSENVEDNSGALNNSAVELETSESENQTSSNGSDTGVGEQSTSNPSETKSDEQNQVDLTKLRDLIDDAKQTANLRIATEDKDPAVVSAYSEKKEELLSKIASLENGILQEENPSTQAVKDAEDELESLHSGLKEAIQTLEDTIATDKSSLKTLIETAKSEANAVRETVGKKPELISAYEEKKEALLDKISEIEADVITPYVEQEAVTQAEEDLQSVLQDFEAAVQALAADSAVDRNELTRQVSDATSLANQEVDTQYKNPELVAAYEEAKEDLLAEIESIRNNVLSPDYVEQDLVDEAQASLAEKVAILNQAVSELDADVAVDKTILETLITNPDSEANQAVSKTVDTDNKEPELVEAYLQKRSEVQAEMQRLKKEIVDPYVNFETYKAAEEDFTILLNELKNVIEAVEQAQKVNKDAMVSLVEKAEQFLNKQVKTANKDQALVAAYQDLYQQVTDEVAKAWEDVLDNTLISQLTIDSRTASLTRLVERFEQSIENLEMDYPTYRFYIPITGSEPQLVSTQIFTEDGTLVEPVTPTVAPGRVFRGWYYADGENFNQLVDFNEVIVGERKLNPDVTIEARIEGQASVTYNSQGTDQETRPYVLRDGVETHADNLAVEITTPGKVFKHWSLTPDGPAYDFETEVLTKDITLYAVLEDKWKVSFVTGSGSSVTTELRDYNASLNVSEIKSIREGYNFSHWSTSQNGSPVSDTTSVTGDMTLYAVWTPRTDTKYTVLHYLQNANDDGYTLVYTEERTGTTGTNTSYTRQTTGQFAAQYAVFDNATQSTISGDGTTTVRVEYKRRTYTYLFQRTVFGRNYIITSGTFRYQQDLRPIFDSAVAMSGVNQQLWNTNVPSGTGDLVSIGFVQGPAQNLTMTQSTGSVPYVVNRVIEGETEQLPSLNLNTNNNLIINYSSPNFTLPGFDIVRLRQDGTGEEVTSGSVRLTPTSNSATFTYRRHVNNVNFYLNDKTGDVVKSQVAYDKPIEIPSSLASYVIGETKIVREGITYVFTGWYDNVAGGGTPVAIDGSNKMPDGEVSYYAGWDEQPLKVTIYHDKKQTESTVKYVLKGNTLSQAEDGGITLEQAVALLQPESGFNTTSTQYGGDFEGWYQRVVQNGTVVWSKYNMEGPITTDVELIPIWKEKVATVTYDANGGSGPLPSTDVQVLHSSYVIKSGSELTNGDKNFVGWSDGTKTYRAGEEITLSQDVVLTAVWSEPRPLTASVTNRTYTEDANISAVRVVTVNKTPYSVVATDIPDYLSGINVSSSGILTGSNVQISDWGATEETRAIPITLQVTSGEELVEVVWTLTIHRDTDGDRIADTSDTDDDNDGIPDSQEASAEDKKIFTQVTASSVSPDEENPTITVVNGQRQTATTVITDLNKPSSVVKITSPTVNGLYVNNSGQLVGRPNIPFTGDGEGSEEEAVAKIPVTITTTARNGKTGDVDEPVYVDVYVKVYRDSDGDGIPDYLDDDDDNDGFPDVDEPGSSKVFTDLTASAIVKTVVEKQEMEAEKAISDVNKPNVSITQNGSLPSGLSGVSIDANGNITGTPVISNWGAKEEVRTTLIPVRVASLDKNGNPIVKPDGSVEFVDTTVTLIVQRDTDGDGEPDITDLDDDNDGIPDDQEKSTNPKVVDALAATPYAKIGAQGVALTDTTPAVTANKPGSSFAISQLPAELTGIDIDPVTGALVGTPNVANWNNQTSRSFTLDVTVTFVNPNTQAVETTTVQVPFIVSNTYAPVVSTQNIVKDLGHDNEISVDLRDGIRRITDVEDGDGVNKFTRTYKVTDPDGQTVTVTGDTAVISKLGNYTVEVIATDKDGFTDTNDYTLTAKDETKPTAPTVDSVSTAASHIPVSIPTADTAKIEVTLNDEASTVLTATKDANGNWTLADGTEVSGAGGKLNLPIPEDVQIREASAADSSVPRITAIATDASGNVSNPGFGQVTNEAPEITAPSLDDVNKGTSEFVAIDIKATVNDAEDREKGLTPTITYTVTGPNGEIVEVADGQISVKATGEYTIVAIARDSDGKQSAPVTTYTVTVNDNAAPVISAVDRTVTEGTPIVPITVEVSDETDDSLVPTMSGLPDGLTYTDGQITGTPSQLTDWGPTEESRDFTVTITATDSAGNVITKVIIITIVRERIDNPVIEVPEVKTPDPVVTEKPSPIVEKTPQESHKPVSKVKEPVSNALPNTGESDTSLISVLGSMMLGISGLFLLGKKREDEDKD